MTLKQLYKKQKDLDRFIIKNMEHTISPNEMLCNKLLAIIVEVSELANETRVFKHWSKKPSSDKPTLIGEYVDVLHFFLSLGNELGFTAEEVEEAYNFKYEENIKRQLNGY